MSEVDEFTEEEEVEEEIIEGVEEEPEPEIPAKPVKRRVVGRIPKQHRMPVYERTYCASEGEIPPQQQIIPPNYYNPPVPKPLTRRQLQQEAARQVMYEQYVNDQRMQVMRQNQRPRVSTSQKLLNVANRFAGTDRGEPLQICARTNGALFRKPNVNLPSNKPTRNAEQNLNRVIASIAPKTAKSSKKKGFLI